MKTLELVLKRDTEEEDREELIRQLANSYPKSPPESPGGKWEISNRIAERYASQGMNILPWREAGTWEATYAKEVLQSMKKGSEVVDVPGRVLDALGPHGSLMLSGGVWRYVVREEERRKDGKESLPPFNPDELSTHPLEEIVGYVAKEGIAYLEKTHREAEKTRSGPDFPIKTLRPQIEHLAHRYHLRESWVLASQDFKEGNTDEAFYRNRVSNLISASRTGGHVSLVKELSQDNL